MKKTLKISLWIIIFELIGYFLGIVTQKNMYPWYDLLNKSSLTPPSIVFPIVWSSLYALLAVCGYMLWQQRLQVKTRLAGYYFSIQMVMNWLWTFLFFSLHMTTLSFFWIIGIIIFTLLSYKFAEQKMVRILLIPYLLWLTFAGYLNAVIVYANMP